MKVSEALKKRHSTRAFLPRPVTRETIERILEVARYSPSGADTQPWEVAVVSGGLKNEVLGAMEHAFRDGNTGRMDFRYYPEPWGEPYNSRRIECGRLLYEALDISRGDRERRLEQWIANFKAFGAPVVLFFLMHRDLHTGSFMDMGMFIQSVMLAACGEGLATCPQAALGEYPDIVRETLGLGEEHLVLCGMAMGYEDTTAAVNRYRTPRAPVSEFARFLGDGEAIS